MSADKLPNGWRSVKFGDVVRNVNENSRDLLADGVDRVVGLDHLDPGSLRLKRWDSLESLPDGTTFTRKFKPGQVLFGKRRAYQRKVAVSDFEGVCSGDILVFEPADKRMLSEFLPYLVQSDGFFDHALGTSAGSLSPRTKWAELAKYEFALPPLDEQRHVVEVLGMCAELVERSRGALQAAQSLMAAYAHDLCEREAKRGNLTALVDVVEADRPITYGILMPGPHVAGGVPVIKVKDFPAGFVKEDDLLRTSHKIDAEFARSRLLAGDLIISIRGTVGRVAEVGESLAGANITQDTARLSVRGEHDPRFIRAMLDSRFVQSQIMRRVTGLAVKGINIGELRKVAIPTPDLKTQVEHANVLLALSRQVELSQTNLATVVAAGSSLREALLTEGGKS